MRPRVCDCTGLPFSSTDTDIENRLTNDGEAFMFTALTTSDSVNLDDPHENRASPG
jgi:hypothetical protein